MTILKNITAILAVIICVGFVILAGCTTASTGGTVGKIDTNGKLGYGSFIDFWESDFVRITIETQNSYLYEKIGFDGKYTSFRGSYTINQIKSPQDPLYLLVNSYPSAKSRGVETNYTLLSGTSYLTLDCKPIIYLLDDKSKSYGWWQINSDGNTYYSSMTPLQTRKPTGDSDFEIYVLGQEHRANILFTGNIGLISDGTYSSSTVAERTNEIYKVNGRSVSAVFQKKVGDNARMTVILYDAKNHRVVNRADTNVEYGVVSVTS